MISIEQADEIPAGVMEALSPEALADLEYYTGVDKSVSKLSPEIWVVSQNDKPLFAIGAVRLNRLDTKAELWVYATTNLNWMHLPLMKKVAAEWIPERMAASYPGAKLYARVHTPKSIRFVEYFGGKYVTTQNGIKVYEVGSC